VAGAARDVGERARHDRALRVEEVPAAGGLVAVQTLVGEARGDRRLPQDHALRPALVVPVADDAVVALVVDVRALAVPGERAAVGGNAAALFTLPRDAQSVRSSVLADVAAFALVFSVTMPSVATAPTLHGPPDE